MLELFGPKAHVTLVTWDPGLELFGLGCLGWAGLPGLGCLGWAGLAKQNQQSRGQRKKLNLNRKGQWAMPVQGEQLLQKKDPS